MLQESASYSSASPYPSFPSPPAYSVEDQANPANNVVPSAELKDKRSAKASQKYVDSLDRFLRSERWFNQQQFSALKSLGFKSRHSLLFDFERRAPFGVGSHRNRIVVYYTLEFALKVGIDQIIEGVECMR